VEGAVQVFPLSEVKSFRDCAPGELVRFPYEKNSLGFAARAMPDARYGIWLYDKGRCIPKFYRRDGLNELDEFVLSYGMHYSIVVDHTSSFEMGNQDFANTPGVLSLSDKGWRMVIAPPQPPSNPAHFTFTNGELARAQNEHMCARFGSWKIIVPTDDSSRRIELFSFNLSPHQ
jgi:hypothetical protein